MLNVIHTQGDDELAKVFVAELQEGERIEFVESVQPPVPRDQKWVLIVSTLKGCPVKCSICDAGGSYQGKLSVDEILGQVEYLVRRRFPDLVVPTPKLKVQFARMGDPAFNDAVLEALDKLPTQINAPGLLPSVSTVAPHGRDAFFEELMSIKNRHYSDGRFQMQFSIHTTDPVQRRVLVPCKTWSMDQMASYGERFFVKGERKITLNFAPAKGFELDAAKVASLFSPEKFLVKLTPINPTYASKEAGLEGLIDPDQPDVCKQVASEFGRFGFDTLVSIGELEENQIGSNCGMYLKEL